MCALTHRAKPYQLAFLIKNSLDDIIGTQQGACEATLQYQYKSIRFSLIYALFAESSIDTLTDMCVLHNISIKILQGAHAFLRNGNKTFIL